MMNSVPDVVLHGVMDGNIFFLAGFIAVSIPLAVSDIKTRTVSRNASIIALLLMTMPSVLLPDLMGTVASVAVIAAAVLVFEAVRLITGKKLGLADVFYSGTMAAFLGGQKWLAACGMACVSGALFLLLRHAMQKKSAGTDSETLPAGMNQPIPFIPFLACSSVLVEIISFCF